MVAVKSRWQPYSDAMDMSASGVGSPAAKERNSFSRPAGEMISSSVAGSSPGFQKVCHCPRGLTMSSPGPARTS